MNNKIPAIKEIAKWFKVLFSTISRILRNKLILLEIDEPKLMKSGKIRNYGQQKTPEKH